ncbi:hypothetical protein CIG2463D_1013 [Campylobacter iguaniorum]|uniref:hypothetical protein n=1 Tax=Campylobacter iguaniorum TaxID=1244531 RepID=UPI00073A2886|nr:hypothetical protein [Campylobacter iguaniorum]ALV24586.1 hypothetical protein CIG2463D_1013 [Campylobacter iguaniorum]
MQNNNFYTLHFDFSTESGANFFKNVSSFISSIDELNTALCSYIDQEITTCVSIEQVENGSLKAKARDTLKNVDDDKLRRYVKDPREAIADFLIKTKYKLIELLDEKPKLLTSKADEIVCEVLEETQLKDYGYKSNRTAVLKALSNLSQNAKGFSMPPRINLNGNEQEVKSGYQFTLDELDGVMKQRSELKGSFIIKKPDLAGASKWTIINDKAIDVKIIDEEWLKKLKSHEIALRYGDKIAGTLISTSFIDTDLNVINTEYILNDILEIQTPNNNEQQELKI